MRRNWFVLPLSVVLGAAALPPTTSGAGAGPATVRLERAVLSDGLTVTSTTTYVVDPDLGEVHVLAEMEFTNTLPDVRDGYYITRRYFTGFSLPVPVDALNTAAARAGGGSVSITPRLLPGVESFYVLDVDFGPNLFYQQTTRINVTYDILGLDPRSELPSRVNRAYAAFDAFGIGDQGKVTVKVVVPPGFEVETFGNATVSTDLNGYTIYTATDIQEPDEFNIFVSARNDDALASREVALENGATFDVRAWPDDEEWEAFVVEQIEQGVPAMEDLIGQPWPIDGTVELREAYTPYLYGYAGWFSTRSNDIEIDEELDQDVVLHELLHAWFNDEWLAERWMNEGFAQVYAAEIGSQLGGDPPQPLTPSRTDPGRVPLAEWDTPAFDDGTDDSETFGYNASYFVIREIFEEIGPEAMRDVLALVAEEDIAYHGEAAPEPGPGRIDWKRLLDLLEEVGGSTEAPTLFEDWVLTAADAALLEDRAAAREGYHALVERGGAWAAPLAVRNALARWQFDDATELIAAAGSALDDRDRLDELAQELGAAYPDTFETEFQVATAATDLEDVRAALAAQIAAAEELLAAEDAEAADDGLLGSIGLMGTDLPGELAAATAAWEAGDLEAAAGHVNDVEAALADADDVGLRRVLTAAAIVVGLILLIVAVLWVRRRRRRARAAAAEHTVAGDATTTVMDSSVDSTTEEDRDVHDPEVDADADDGGSDSGSDSDSSSDSDSDSSSDSGSGGDGGGD